MLCSFTLAYSIFSMLQPESLFALFSESLACRALCTESNVKAGLRKSLATRIFMKATFFCIFRPSMTSPTMCSVALTECSDSYINMVNVPFSPASPTTYKLLEGLGTTMTGHGHTYSLASPPGCLIWHCWPLWQSKMFCSLTRALDLHLCAQLKWLLAQKQAGHVIFATLYKFPNCQ